MISTTEITACANESRCAKVLCRERVSQRLSCSRRHASRGDRALNFVTWPGQRQWPAHAIGQFPRMMPSWLGCGAEVAQEWTKAHQPSGRGARLSSFSGAVYHFDRAAIRRDRPVEFLHLQPADVSLPRRFQRSTIGAAISILANASRKSARRTARSTSCSSTPGMNMSLPGAISSTLPADPTRRHARCP
jgi:hypothetical protein